MPQQPVFAKRSSGTSAVLASTRAEAEPELRAIPLALKPLLEPYKGQEKVTLRVERLPQRARLSAGQNNGDQSFSLAPDDLDDLVYLLPSDITEPHSLAIRVISRLDGSTVAMLSHKISPADMASAAAPRAATAPSSQGLDELKALHEQLAQAKAALSQSEATSQARAKQSEEEWAARSAGLVEQALAKARAEWDAEFSGRLKALADRAEQTLVSRRTAWQAEFEARIAAADKRADEARTLAREGWRHEAEQALAKARDNWKAAEEVRLAAAETRWREQAQAAEVEARAQMQRSQQRDGTELAQLRGELAALKSASDLRARELDAAKVELVQARDAWRRDSEAALAAAKRTWSEQEGARLVEAEARLKAEAATALAESVARRERTEKALGEAVKQIEMLSVRRESDQSANDDVSAMRAALAAAQASLAQAREQGLKDLEEKLAEAKARWKAEEDTKLAAAEARLREQADMALAEAAAQRGRAEAALADMRARSAGADSDEKRRFELEARIGTLEAALKARESEVTAVRQEAQQGTETALLRARQEWSAGEAARLREAEAQWRAQSGQALDSATRRAEAAEQQAAQARLQQQEPNPRDRIEILRLKDELEKMRINLEVRDIELRQARSRALPSYEGEGPGAPVLTPLRKSRMAMKDDPAEKEERRRKSRSLMRDIVLVAFVVFLIALAPLSRPYIEPLLPYDMQDEIDQTFGELQVAAPPPAPAKPAPQPTAAPAPRVAAETVLRASNLHAAPSKTSAVVATLPAGSKVVPLSQQGSWVRVSLGELGDGQQGWVYGSALSGPGATPAH